MANTVIPETQTSWGQFHTDVVRLTVLGGSKPSLTRRCSYLLGTEALPTRTF